MGNQSGRYSNKKEIELDLFHCKGCGACVELAPEHFLMDDDNDLPKVIDSIVEGEHDDLEQAMAMCPMACIQIKEIE